MAKIFTPARNLCACHGRQALRELIMNQLMAPDGAWATEETGGLGGWRPFEWMALDRGIPGRELEDMKTEQLTQRRWGQNLL